MVSFRFSPGTLALHVVIGQMQLLIDRKALGQTKEMKNRVKDICLNSPTAKRRISSFQIVSNFIKSFKYIKNAISNICFPPFLQNIQVYHN